MEGAVKEGTAKVGEAKDGEAKETAPARAANSGYYREEFARIARYYDFGVGFAFRWVGGEIGFRCGIVEMADVQPAQHVLDVACGTGTLLGLLAACTGPDGRAVGVDMSEQMLAVGRRKHSLPQIEFIHANAEALPFADSSFDRVTASLAIHEMNRVGRGNTFSEMRRVLKPGGLVVVADMRCPDTLGTRLGMRFVRLFEKDTLLDLWSHGLYREMYEAGFTDLRRKISGRRFFEIIAGRK